jgi:imidazoleglycerol-phosphate dehydratase
MPDRTAEVTRKTRETDITLALNVDGKGQANVKTGVGFLDHMLEAVASHGLFDLTVSAKGDLHVDPHHTIEDVGLVLGMAFDRALGDRSGIRRMGYAYVPMDEALARVVVDLSGRPYTIFEAVWHSSAIGDFPTTLVGHFFESVAVQARMNLHAHLLYGGDDHHQAEALFKAFARAMSDAVSIDPRRGGVVPSTKGVL